MLAGRCDLMLQGKFLRLVQADSPHCVELLHESFDVRVDRGIGLVLLEQEVIPAPPLVGRRKAQLLPV